MNCQHILGLSHAAGKVYVNNTRMNKTSSRYLQALSSNHILKMCYELLAVTFNSPSPHFLQYEFIQPEHKLVMRVSTYLNQQ